MTAHKKHDTTHDVGTHSPGSDPCLVIGRAVHRVDPGSATQDVHWLSSRKGGGRPLPSVSHHVVQSCAVRPTVHIASEHGSRFH